MDSYQQLALAYLICGVLLLAVAAVINRDDMLIAVTIVLLWPLVMAGIALDLLIGRFLPDWRLDAVRSGSHRMFGFRPRPAGKGWAITCFWIEFQIWKVGTP